MMVASTIGSSATPYNVLPEGTSVSDGPADDREVTRFPLLTTVPDEDHAFARLFAPLAGVTFSVNVPSSLIAARGVERFRRVTRHSHHDLLLDSLTANGARGETGHRAHRSG